MKELYKPFVSSAKNKKYSVYVQRDGRRRLIHFGDSRYGQFHDKLGHYSSNDHNDEDGDGCTSSGIGQLAITPAFHTFGDQVSAHPPAIQLGTRAADVTARYLLCARSK